MAAINETLSAAFNGLLDTATPEEMSHLTRTTLSFDSNRLESYIDITFSLINDEPCSIHDEFVFEPTEHHDPPSDFVSSIADTISTAIDGCHVLNAEEPPTTYTSFIQNSDGCQSSIQFTAEFTPM